MLFQCTFRILGYDCTKAIEDKDNVTLSIWFNSQIIKYHMTLMFKSKTHQPVSLDFHFCIKELKQWWLLMKKEWKKTTKYNFKKLLMSNYIVSQTE